MKNKKVEKYQALLPLFQVPTQEGIKSIKWNFMAICNKNSTLRDTKLDANLKCRYQHHSDFYLKLGPFKLEEISKEPIVIMFHGFLADKESDKIVR